MDKTHAHAAALDRIGSEKIQEHFQITRQSLYNWRMSGIPKPHRNSVVLLGETLGLDMSDLKAMAEA